MDPALSEALTIARKWQHDATEVHCTMQAREWVIDFGGRLIIEGNGISVTDKKNLDFRLVLDEAMTFRYADGMLKIGGSEWHCNLYETKDHKFVRLVKQPHL
jgi:hypothetical protein